MILKLIYNKIFYDKKTYITISVMILKHVLITANKQLIRLISEQHFITTMKNLLPICL